MTETKKLYYLDLQVMILEDDAFFAANFKDRLTKTLTQIKSAQVQWDLIYLGRKRLDWKSEEQKVATYLKRSFHAVIYLSFYLHKNLYKL